MKITKHFNYGEFVCKDTKRTPYPKEWTEERLRPLCEALEVLRELIKTSDDQSVRVIITSGYRTPAYNKKIGGAPRSQHVEGKAADIVCWFKNKKDEWEEIPALLIADYWLILQREGKVPAGGLGFYRSFTHVDIRGRNARWGPLRGKSSQLGKK